MQLVILGIFLSFLIISIPSFAEDKEEEIAPDPFEAAETEFNSDTDTTDDDQANQEESIEEAPPPKITPVRKKQQPYAREKKFEGTNAPAGRFKVETIIKSKYQINGESLDVDPD